MKKKHSIHDLAKQLGVSATAISFVINGKAEEKGISEGLQQKILAYISEVGYQPNMVAQSLRTGKTKIVGMLVEDISDHFFSHIARRIEELLSKLGYKLFIASTENDTAKTKALLKVFRDRQVDGYIIAPPPGIEKELVDLMDDGLPVILFDRNFSTVNTNNVVINNCEAVYEALLHLYENGFCHVGFITLASSQLQMEERRSGYKLGAKRSTQKEYILEVPYHTPAKNTIQRIKVFIHTYPELDALLFATNYLTVAGLEALKELKMRIPEDLAVVSFDDNDHFRILSPTITAVAQPLSLIAEKVVDRLIACLKSEAEIRKKETVQLRTELIVRGSSKQTKKGAPL